MGTDSFTTHSAGLNCFPVHRHVMTLTLCGDTGPLICRPTHCLSIAMTSRLANQCPSIPHGVVGTSHGIVGHSACSVHPYLMVWWAPAMVWWGTLPAVSIHPPMVIPIATPWYFVWLEFCLILGTSSALIC